MARDIRKSTAGPKAKAAPFALPGMAPFRPKPAPPRRAAYPGAPGGLSVQKAPKPKVPVVHTAATPKPKVVPRVATVRTAAKTSVVPRRTTTPTPTSRTVAPHKIAAPARRAAPRPPVRRPAQQSQVVGPADTSAQSDEQAYIDAILGPGRDQLNYLRSQQQAADQQRLGSIQGLTNEFLSYLSKVPGQVQSDYSSAIDQQMNMGREAQQALASASTNPAVQSDLQAIGAPQAQQNQVADKLGATFNGGGAVLLGTGGQIPAQQLSADQAAQLAFVRSLPAVAAATGQQTLRNYLTQSQGAYNDLNQQYSQLESQVPKLLLDYRSQQAGNAAKQAQLDLEYRALGLKANNQKFQQGATKVRLNQGAARINQGAQRLTLQTRQQQTANAMRFAEIYGYDPKTGKPTLAAVKAAKADAKKKNKPPSTAALKNWNLFAEDAYHGVAPKTRYDSKSQTFLPIPGTGKQPVQYYPALKKLLAMGASLSQAQKVLNALYKKGEGGRPHVPLQGRIALQKAGMPLSGSNSVPTQAQIDWLRAHGLWSD